MKKCKYCGREISSRFKFCCNKCENDYTKNIEKAEGKIKLSSDKEDRQE